MAMGYNLVYIFGNIFLTYIIYRYIHVFFDKCSISSILEWLCYLEYFICISVAHRYMETPMIIFCSNVILVTLNAMLYECDIRHKIFAILTIVISLITIEVIIATSIGLLQVNGVVPAIYKSEITIVLIDIFAFTFLKLANGFKNARNTMTLPIGFWIGLLVIPAITIFLVFVIYLESNLPRPLLLACLLSAFIINGISFYLYDKLAGIMREHMNIKIAEEKHKFYEYQVEMMQENMASTRVLRHDMKNKLYTLHVMAQNKEYERLMTSLEELTDASMNLDEYSHSGNTTIDSIINYKLKDAKQEGISVSVDILVPMDIEVPTFDMAIILGNLLDNAIEAVAYVEERWIDIKMKYSKGQLLLEISNSYDGIINRDDKGIVTRKEDKKNHGVGIKSVEEVLKKYDGILRIKDESGVFTAEVLMYI